MTELSDSATLADAREYLEVMKYDKGIHCPCCGQFARVYWRTLNSQMARSLILLYRKGGTTDWVHAPTILGGLRADEGKLRYWGLLEESMEHKDTGGKSGYWRVTKQGEKFVLGKVLVPQYALVYNGECLDFDGDQISIHHSLGSRFSYDELMAMPGERKKKT